MNTAAAPELSPALGQAASSQPPSLRRRAPARISIELRSGRCPSITRRKLHLRNGQAFALQVTPPTATAAVDIRAESPLQTLIPPSKVEGGPLPVYHAEFSGRLPLRVIPIPATGKLHVSVIDGLPSPCRITIPVTVWPSYLTLAGWWALACLGIVGLRWQKLAADGSTVPDIVRALREDLPHAVCLFVGGLFALPPVLWLIGQIVSWFDSGESND